MGRRSRLNQNKAMNYGYGEQRPAEENGTSGSSVNQQFCLYFAILMVLFAISFVLIVGFFYVMANGTGSLERLWNSLTDKQETDIAVKRVPGTGSNHTDGQAAPIAIGTAVEPRPIAETSPTHFRDISPISIQASGTLDEHGADSLYSPRNLFDKKKDTFWAVHVEENNMPYLNFKLDNQTVCGIVIANGHQGKEVMFASNMRTKNILVTANSGFVGELTFKEGGFNKKGLVLDTVFFREPLRGISDLKIEFSSFYKGNRWNDLFISELYLLTD